MSAKKKETAQAEKTVHQIMRELQAIEDLTVNNHGEASRIMLEEFYNILIKYLIATVAISDPAGYHKVIKDWHTLIARSIQLVQKADGLEEQICAQLKINPNTPNYKEILEEATKLKLKGTQDMLDDIAMDYASIVSSDANPSPIKITKTKAKKAPKKKSAPKANLSNKGKEGDEGSGDKDGYYDESGNFISV